jgi:glycerate 2-kinase
MSPCHPRIVVAPDSFKGSLSAPEVAAAIAAGLRSVLGVLPPEAILEIPLADGGEGTLETVLAALQGDRHVVSVTGAAGYQRMAAMGYCYPAKEVPFAILETAAVVGITDTIALSSHVLNRSTRGLGEQLRKGLDQGMRKFLIGLGGSSTNEGGAGLLHAVGVQFRNQTGQAIEPTPVGLLDLAAVDLSGLDPRLRETQLILLADVKNPLCGEQGATHTFGGQKGLTDRTLREVVDRTLKRYAKLTTQAFATLPDWPFTTAKIYQRKGAGAAGGLGFALQLLGAEYRSGAQEIAQLVHLPQALQGADWLITGEGKSDRQTLNGKAPYRAAKLAQAAQVKQITVLSGLIEAQDAPQLQKKLSAEDCFSLMGGRNCIFAADAAPQSISESQFQAKEWLFKAGVQLGQRWLNRKLKRHIGKEGCGDGVPHKRALPP